MILDNLLTFTGSSNTVGAPPALASGLYTDSPTTGTQVAANIVDLGVLNGLPPTAVGGGGARDIGTGDRPSLKLSAIVTVAFAAGTSLALTLQGAPDAGANTPGSIEMQIVIDRDDQVVGITGAYSGYPAGIVVAN